MYLIKNQAQTQVIHFNKTYSKYGVWKKTFLFRDKGIDRYMIETTDTEHYLSSDNNHIMKRLI